jgi:uncharacterized protein YbjT (DUF2867 family)
MPITAKSHRRVLLAGATGLVGGQILQALLADASVAEVHALGRRALAIRHPKLQSHVVEFHRLPLLPSVDEVYLALGTTMGTAGTRKAFREVDLKANLAAARAGFVAGARRMALVSAVGADSHSRVFYTRVKGELEDALARMNLAALVIARPSLLLGDRDALKQPLRMAEKIAIRMGNVLAPVLPRHYWPVHAQAVARSLVKTLPTSWETVVLHSDDLIRIGGSGETER